MCAVWAQLFLRLDGYHPPYDIANILFDAGSFEELLMPLLDEVAEHIVANTTNWVIGSTTGSVAVWLGEDRGRPGPNVVLYETEGFIPRETFGGTLPHFEQPRLQVISRSSAYLTARENAEEVFRILDAVTNSTLSSTSSNSTATYMRIQALQSPFFVGRSEDRNALISCNYTIQRIST